jgi:hypothetical protein
MEQAGSDYVLAGRVLHAGSIVLTHAVLVYWRLGYLSALFLYLVLNLQTNAFSEWAMPYRTSDLLLVSYVEVFLLRSVLLGNSAYLSDFQRFSPGANPAVFGSVLLRLQHVCSTL